MERLANIKNALLNGMIDSMISAYGEQNPHTQKAAKTLQFAAIMAVIIVTLGIFNIVYDVNRFFLVAISFIGILSVIDMTGTIKKAKQWSENFELLMRHQQDEFELADAYAQYYFQNLFDSDVVEDDDAEIIVGAMRQAHFDGFRLNRMNDKDILRITQIAINRTFPNSQVVVYPEAPGASEYDQP